MCIVPIVKMQIVEYQRITPPYGRDMKITSMTAKCHNYGAVKNLRFAAHFSTPKVCMTKIV